MRVLVTRPMEASKLLAGKIQSLGMDVHMAPMLEIHLNQSIVPLDDVAVLVYTSLNAVRATRENAPDFEGLVFAVGETTAAELRAAGFKNVIAAAGDVESLVDCISEYKDSISGPILHLSGEETHGDLMGDLENLGLNAKRQIVYSAEPCEGFEAEIQQGIKEGDYEAVLFFSPRTARRFVSLLEECNLTPHMKTSRAIVMSDAVAGEIAGLPWKEVLLAAQPDETAMIKCLKGI